MGASTRRGLAPNTSFRRSSRTIPIPNVKKQREGMAVFAIENPLDQTPLGDIAQNSHQEGVSASAHQNVMPAPEQRHRDIGADGIELPDGPD